MNIHTLFKRKSEKNKKIVIILFVIVTFLLGIIVSILLYNRQQNDRNQNVEITFVDSHQAIVFWTTQNETIGFVKYGENESKLDQVVKQTSSAVGTIHAVVIEDIPLEGVYISLHNESDSPFLFQQTQRIIFDPEKYIE